MINNDLKQIIKWWINHCKELEEKISLLQDNYEFLKKENIKLQNELSSYKGRY